MGFSTILDIIGATIIGGLLLLTIVRLNSRAQENLIVYGSDKILQNSVVNLATLLEEDFRKVGYCADPNKITDTTDLIITADLSSISFRADLNRDGNLDVVKYFISDTVAMNMTKNPRDRILYRQINSDMPLIVNSNIVQFRIKYFDVLDTELTAPVNTPSLVAHLEISFKVEDPEAYDEQYSEAYWQQVRLSSRNLGKR